MKNHKKIVVTLDFCGTKCKRQKQLLATLERENIASPKSRIPKVWPALTLLVVVPTTLVVEATISIQAQASTTWLWRVPPPWMQVTWAMHHALGMFAGQQAMLSFLTPL